MLMTRRRLPLFMAALLALFIHFGLSSFLPVLTSNIRTGLEKKTVRMQVLESKRVQPDKRTESDTLPLPEKTLRRGSPAEKAAHASRKASGKKTTPDPAARSQKTHPAQASRATGHAAASQVSRSPMPDPARKNPLPDYPVLARKRGNEGTVLLHCLVDENGNVTRVEISRGSGFRILDEAARKAVLRWHFLPATTDGRPEVGTIILPIEFRLER